MLLNKNDFTKIEYPHVKTYYNPKAARNKKSNIINYDEK